MAGTPLFSRSLSTEMLPKLRGLARSKSTPLTGVLFLALALPTSVLTDSSDHIGPDPIQSENCVMITPERSVTCSGEFLERKNDTRPRLTINCGPGLFMLISHPPTPAEAATRRVRLISEDGELSREWLAISKSQSAFLVFDGGREQQDYQWMVRLIGQLLTPTNSAIGYSFDDDSIEGIFELDFSDRKLIEQLAPNC